MLLPEIDILLRQLHRPARQRIVRQKRINCLVYCRKRRNVLFRPVLEDFRWTQVSRDECGTDGIDCDVFLDEDWARGTTQAYHAVLGGGVLRNLWHVTVFDQLLVEHVSRQDFKTYYSPAALLVATKYPFPPPAALLRRT